MFTLSQVRVIFRKTVPMTDVSAKNQLSALLVIEKHANLA